MSKTAQSVWENCLLFIKDNIQDQAYKTWFENGQLRIEGQYDNGIKIGNWRFFDEKGNVIEEKNFSENPEQ